MRESMYDNTEVIRTEGDLRAVVRPDPYPELERGTDFGTLSILATAGWSHYIGDSGPVAEHIGGLLRDGGAVEAAAVLREEYGATVIVPLCRFGDEWRACDSASRAVEALLFDTAATREAAGTPPELVHDAVLAELAELNSYLAGDVWDVSIERKAVWRRDDDPGITRTTWEPTDLVDGYESLHGVVGREWAEKEANEYLDAAVGRALVIEAVEEYLDDEAEKQRTD